MVESNEVKAWDLTKEECANLQRRWERRQGAHILLIQLQEIEGQVISAEHAWWDGVMIRHKIPTKYQHRVIADHISGKIWVKGEVTELDTKVRILQHDNPC